MVVEAVVSLCFALVWDVEVSKCFVSFLGLGGWVAVSIVRR